MSDADDPELSELLAELTTTLRELQSEVEPEGPPEPRLRPPTPEELSRFTSEIAIPGMILVLKTNVRALQLLQRAIRLANGRDPAPEGSVSEVRTRAERVGRASLSQLDSVLDEMQSALEGRPDDEDAHELLSRARTLQRDVSEQLEAASEPAEDGEATDSEFADGSNGVEIDIESELQSLKDNMDDDGSPGSSVGTGDGAGDGADAPTDNGSDTPDGEDSPSDDGTAGNG